MIASVIALILSEILFHETQLPPVVTGGNYASDAGNCTLVVEDGSIPVSG